MKDDNTEPFYSDTEIVTRLISNLEGIIRDANQEIQRLEGKRSQAESSLAYMKAMRKLPKN